MQYFHLQIQKHVECVLNPSLIRFYIPKIISDNADTHNEGDNDDFHNADGD